ncbi:MAG: bifunctional phosphoribosylaminoimidazolecarboxamide formyltransferase/IMP cyclohydrolase [Candidatus Zixiibacteriota bacterium]
MAETKKIQRALISVSNKAGIEKLSSALHSMGVQIISTGGTLKAIKDAGIAAVSVSTFTGAPEIFAGRVKTLHPKIHAGILFRRDVQDDVDELARLDYRRIDLVVANLYPFEETVARQGVTDQEAIENIDIGGPSMLRAAAKNFSAVTVIVDPADYDPLIKQMEENGGVTDMSFRRCCAQKVFQHTSRYDTAINAYFETSTSDGSADFPSILSTSYVLRDHLRYGENPHQKAALYEQPGYQAQSLLRADTLSGKELSYNNYNDLDACLGLLLEFDQPFACLLKHANPCGAAVGDDIAVAYQRAYKSDPLSAFGSIIGLNRTVDIECAKALHETPFVECILAPGFDDDAFSLLKKKKNRRILALPEISNGRTAGLSVHRQISGGLLVQTADDCETVEAELKVVTKRTPSDEQIRDLLFAWKVVKHTKSNAIVLAKGGATVGIGMGQTSRVDSSFMAVKRAGDRASGAVMASDAFFPMPDGVEVATEAGVCAIIQPGGSKGDEQVIEAADKAEAAMVFTGKRHFKH